MSEKPIEVPVEYHISTTSDWTNFEIIEGGWWTKRDAVCLKGCDRVKHMEFNDRIIKINKAPNDETLVEVKAKCTLNIDKRYLHSDIKYSITKGDLKSTTVKIITQGKRIIPEKTNRSNIEGNPYNPMTFKVLTSRHGELENRAIAMAIQRRRTKTEWEEKRQKIVNLQSDFALFKAEFFDRDKFKRFANDLVNKVESNDKICITGYFSEAIREELERIVKVHSRNVRLICPALDVKSSRDRKSLQVLKKLNKVGAEIRVNDRLHARFLASYISGLLKEDEPMWRGTLLIGSFDFNKEGMTKERYDAGIKTSHPDLIESAVKLFEEIWNESSPLLEKYEDEIKKFKL